MSTLAVAGLTLRRGGRLILDRVSLRAMVVQIPGSLAWRDDLHGGMQLERRSV